MVTEAAARRPGAAGEAMAIGGDVLLNAMIWTPGLVVDGLPFAELGIGALLVAQIARRPVAIVAGVVLLAFTTLLVVRLSQGRRPPCACFGAFHPFTMRQPRSPALPEPGPVSRR